MGFYRTLSKKTSQEDDHALRPASGGLQLTPVSALNAIASSASSTRERGTSQTFVVTVRSVIHSRVFPDSGNVRLMAAVLSYARPTCTRMTRIELCRSCKQGTLGFKRCDNHHPPHSTNEATTVYVLFTIVRCLLSAQGAPLPIGFLLSTCTATALSVRVCAYIKTWLVLLRVAHFE